MSRYELKRQRRLEDDPYASEPSSVSNSTFTLSDDDDGWLSRQAEMVLEPYFMSLDSTWSRLQVPLPLSFYQAETRFAVVDL